MIETTREQALDGVRQLADFLESHPEVPLPMELQNWHHLALFTNNIKEFRAVAKAFGSFNKGTNGTADDLFEIRKSFGAITLKVFASREQVCERVVVGVDEIPETVIPERIVPARKVEKVEWKCTSLLNPDEVAA